MSVPVIVDGFQNIFTQQFNRKERDHHKSSLCLLRFNKLIGLFPFLVFDLGEYFGRPVSDVFDKMKQTTFDLHRGKQSSDGCDKNNIKVTNHSNGSVKDVQAESLTNPLDDREKPYVHFSRLRSQQTKQHGERHVIIHQGVEYVKLGILLYDTYERTVSETTGMCDKYSTWALSPNTKTSVESFPSRWCDYDSIIDLTSTQTSFSLNAFIPEELMAWRLKRLLIRSLICWPDSSGCLQE